MKKEIGFGYSYIPNFWGFHTQYFGVLCVGMLLRSFYFKTIMGRYLSKKHKVTNSYIQLIINISENKIDFKNILYTVKYFGPSLNINSLS